MVFDARVNSVRRGAATLALLAGVMTGCDRPETPSEPPPPATAPTPSPAPTLDRAALLAAMASVASDTAAGIARDQADPLIGRTFSLRMAFGCFGAQPEPANQSTNGDGTPRWATTADGRSIRLTLYPADWSEGDISGPPPTGFETLSGIWINQPWMRSESCPAWSIAAPDVSADVAPAREAGLIMVRPTGGSRIGRAGERGFTHTVRGEGDEPATPPTQGYRLVLEGRLTGWADGRVVRCRIVTPDRPPGCVIGAVVDRVAFEDGAGGTVLSEWRPG